MDLGFHITNIPHSNTLQWSISFLLSSTWSSFWNVQRKSSVKISSYVCDKRSETSQSYTTNDLHFHIGSLSFRPYIQLFSQSSTMRTFFLVAHYFLIFSHTYLQQILNFNLRGHNNHLLYQLLQSFQKWEYIHRTTTISFCARYCLGP